MNNLCMTVYQYPKQQQKKVYIFEIQSNLITEGTEKWHGRNENPWQIGSLKKGFIKKASEITNVLFKAVSLKHYRHVRYLYCKDFLHFYITE